MITVVLPMAGEGSRFYKAGYKLPKYMLEVKNRSLFEYSLLSLPLEVVDRIIFIGLKKHDLEYGLYAFIEEKVQRILNGNNYSFDTQIILLNEVTRGQAETVLTAKDNINQEHDILIYNIDTYSKSSSLGKKLLKPELKKNGILGAFEIGKNENKWSFARVNEDGLVIETAEKVKISNYALTGLYHFTCAQHFIDIAEDYIKSNKRTKNEFYIAPMYNDLILRNMGFVIDVVDEFIALGTPEDIEKFRMS